MEGRGERRGREKREEMGTDTVVYKLRSSFIYPQSHSL